MSCENWTDKERAFVLCRPVVNALGGAERLCVGPNTRKTAFQPLPLLFKANLPLLQRELLHCARAAKQTPSQYLAQHEHLLLNTSIASPADSSELLMEVHGNGKRPSPERWAEKGFFVLDFLEPLWVFPFLWKKKNWMTVVIYRYGLRISKASFALSQHQAAECFSALQMTVHPVGPLLQNHRKYNLFKAFFSDVKSYKRVITLHWKLKLIYPGNLCMSIQHYFLWFVEEATL